MCVLLQYIGSFAAPDDLQVVTALPKTDSGHIVRHVLAKLAMGETENFGDVSMIADKNLLQKLVKQIRKADVQLKGAKPPQLLKKVRKPKEKKLI